MLTTEHTENTEKLKIFVYLEVLRPVFGAKRLWSKAWAGRPR